MCVCVCVCVCDAMRCDACIIVIIYIWVNIVVADDLTPVWHQDICNYHGDVATNAQIVFYRHALVYMYRCQYFMFLIVMTCDSVYIMNEIFVWTQVVNKLLLLLLLAWSANILRELLATELHLWFELWRLIYHAYNMRTKPQSGDIQQPFLSYISGAVALKVPKTRHDASVKHGLTVRVHKHKL